MKQDSFKARKEHEAKCAISSTKAARQLQFQYQLFQYRTDTTTNTRFNVSFDIYCRRGHGLSSHSVIRPQIYKHTNLECDKKAWEDTVFKTGRGDMIKEGTNTEKALAS